MKNRAFRVSLPFVFALPTDFTPFLTHSWLSLCGCAAREVASLYFCAKRRNRIDPWRAVVRPDTKVARFHSPNFGKLASPR
jgi:hypothetical protein